MTLKVIGAGFGRTGTLSLQAALETLGFARCYHMREVIGRPHHARLWLEAHHGAGDWVRLFQGYQAAVDWPTAAFYQALMVRYPEAKVILTLRDPERWYESARSTIYQARQVFPERRLVRFLPVARDYVEMLDAIIWQGTFHNRFEDQDYALEVFARHNAEVQRVVPPDRLLVYTVKEGWAPLCAFLQVPVPAEMPFPHLNDMASFQRRIVWPARVLHTMTVGGAGVGLLWLARKLWQR